VLQDDAAYRDSDVRKIARSVLVSVSVSVSRYDSDYDYYSYCWSVCDSTNYSDGVFDLRFS
jgi:hypothetical protein